MPEKGKFDHFFLNSKRGQIVHSVGAQFGVFMPLQTRDKTLNVLKFCRNHRERKNKRRTEEQRDRACCGIHLQFSEYTVWSRNVCLGAKIFVKVASGST